MICDAYKAGYCWGCDVGRDHYFKSEEAIEKNEFDYYIHKKSCTTLAAYRKKKQNAECNAV